MTPGRFRNERRPQHRPESVRTGTTGRCAWSAMAAMPGWSGKGLPGAGAGAFREDDDGATFALCPLGLFHQVTDGGGAGLAIHDDHAGWPDHASEERDAGQLAFHHVNGVRQQRQPHHGVEGRLVAGGDQRCSVGQILHAADFQPDAANPVQAGDDETGPEAGDAEGAGWDDKSRCGADGGQDQSSGRRNMR